MKSCRYCGGDADPMLSAQRYGNVCRPCCRAILWKRMNDSAAGKRRSRAQYAKIGPRRVRIGRRIVGLATTPELAQQINAHVRRRLCALKQRQSPDPEMETLAPDGVAL